MQLVKQYSSIKSISSLVYNVILTKLCLMCNNTRMTFVFEKFESDNTLFFYNGPGHLFVD